MYALMNDGKVVAYAEESVDNSVKLYRLMPNHEFKLMCIIDNNDSYSIIDALIMKSMNLSQWIVIDEHHVVVGSVGYSYQNGIVELCFDMVEHIECPKIIRYDSITVLENAEEIKKEDIIETISLAPCKLSCKYHGIDGSNDISVYFDNGLHSFSGRVKCVKINVDGKESLGVEVSKYGDKLSSRVVIDNNEHEWLQVIEYPMFKGDHGFVIFYDMDKIGDKNVDLLELSRDEKKRIDTDAMRFRYTCFELHDIESIYDLYNNGKYAGNILITNDSIHFKCFGLKREGNESELLYIELNKLEYHNDVARGIEDIIDRKITTCSFEMNCNGNVYREYNGPSIRVMLKWMDGLLYIYVKDSSDKRYEIAISRVERIVAKNNDKVEIEDTTEDDFVHVYKILNSLDDEIITIQIKAIKPYSVIITYNLGLVSNSEFIGGNLDYSELDNLCSLLEHRLDVGRVNTNTRRDGSATYIDACVTEFAWDKFGDFQFKTRRDSDKFVYVTGIAKRVVKIK